MRIMGFVLALIGFIGGGVSVALDVAGASVSTLSASIFFSGFFVAGMVSVAIGDAVAVLKKHFPQT